MVDVRKIVIAFIIAALFAILVQVAIDAFLPEPDYNKYCQNQQEYSKVIPYPGNTANCPNITVSEELQNSCTYDVGSIQYKYDANGCAKEAYCETCYITLDKANQSRNLIIFIISAITGLIALVFGLFLPVHKNSINEWLGSGFLLGGIITIIIGTARFYGQMGRFIRPLVIFLELLLVIYLAYKKLGKNGKK